MWSILIAVILVSGSLSLPVWILNSAGLIGQMTIPLMLITLGVSLASIKVSQWQKGVLYSFLRIGLGACVALSVAELLSLQGVSKGVLILQGIMPVAVFNYLFAIKSGRDVEVVASMVMISTLLVMLILPFVLYGLM
jgi:predicted permease